MEAAVKAAAGLTAIEIEVSNRGSSECSLNGRPSVEMIASDNRILPIRTVPDDPPGAPPARPLPPGGLEKVFLTVFSRAECDNAPASKASAVKAIRIRAENNKRLSSLIEETLVNVGCNVAVTSFHSPTPVQEEPPPPASAKLRLPQTGPPGALMIYYVILTNTGTGPFPEGECPSYEQSMTDEGRVLVDGWYRLNCDPGPLQPGQSRAYEMRMQIPDDAPEDSLAKVTWRIPNGQDIFAGGAVQICRSCPGEPD